jgi:hypothetical protein
MVTSSVDSRVSSRVDKYLCQVVFQFRLSRLSGTPPWTHSRLPFGPASLRKLANDYDLDSSGWQIQEEAKRQLTRRSSGRLSFAAFPAKAPYHAQGQMRAEEVALIDRMQRQRGPGTCELCEKHAATRKVKFTANYVQSTAAAIFEEEGLAEVTLEKKVCEACLISLQNAKNVKSLTFERL